MSRAWGRLMVILCLLFPAGVIGAFWAESAGHPPNAAAGPVMVIFSAAGMLAAVRAARVRGLDAGTRRAWWFLVANFALSIVTIAVFVAVPSDGRFPSPGDVVRLFALATVIGAMLSFPVRPAGRSERHKSRLDALTVSFGTAMPLWYFVVGPHLTSGRTADDLVVAAAAYPIGDAVLMFCLARVFLRGADRSVRQPVAYLAAGFLLMLVNDFVTGYSTATTGTMTINNAYSMALILGFQLLMALGAVQQCRQGAVAQPDPPGRFGVATRLPYVAVIVGYLLMVVAVFADGPMVPWAGLVLGAFALTGVVMLRQTITQRETDHLASTDGLTGLPNRQRLLDVLDRALVRAARSGTTTGVLLVDLNGFKQVNDTLGHRSGDVLLVEVARRMQRGVLGSDLVARLGGDEFAVVLHDIGCRDHAESVVRRIQAEMAVPVALGGTLVQPSASIGIGLAEGEQIDAETLLHRADVAMYEVKRAGAPAQP